MSGIPSRLLSLPEFGSNPGALGAKFYCPHDLPAGSPLVVVLHGCTRMLQAMIIIPAGQNWPTKPGSRSSIPSSNAATTRTSASTGFRRPMHDVRG